MNILAIGAHCDDLELGCGASLAKHVKAGDIVHMLIVTHSGYASPEGAIIRSKDVALAEGRAAAAVIGGNFQCLNHETLDVTNDDALAGTLVDIVRQKSIDMVYTHWAEDVHRDHVNVAKASLMATRHVPSVLMYRSNWYLGTKPFMPTLFNDVSDTFGIKLQALDCYASELERVGTAWHDYFTRQAQNDGMVIGAAFAESFEIVRYRM